MMNVRDFRLLPYYTYGDNGHDIVEHLVSRRDKYQARGFQVNTDLPTSLAARKLINQAILNERSLTLIHLCRYEEGVPRSSVEPHVLRSYDRWVSGGRRGEWYLNDASVEEEHKKEEDLPSITHEEASLEGHCVRHT
jgi:hypothetical protein